MGGVYQDWLHKAYTSIVALFLKVADDEQAKYYQGLLMEWTKKTTPTQPITWQVINQPPTSYADFLHTFDLWKNKVDQMTKKFKLI